jgi:hypothetical protein
MAAMAVGDRPRRHAHQLGWDFHDGIERGAVITQAIFSLESLYGRPIAPTGGHGFIQRPHGHRCASLSIRPSEGCLEGIASGDARRVTPRRCGGNEATGNRFAPEEYQKAQL